MRKCSEDENQIIRMHEADILSYDGLPTPSDNTLPILLIVTMFFLGIGIGILVLLSSTNEMLILLLGVLLPIIGTVIFMMCYIKGESHRLLKKRLKPFYRGHFTISEATFLSYQKDYDGRYYETFTYCENSIDGSTEGAEIKYCHTNHKPDLEENSRILILHTEDGYFIPMRNIILTQ